MFICAAACLLWYSIRWMNQGTIFSCFSHAAIKYIFVGEWTCNIRQSHALRKGDGVYYAGILLLEAVGCTSLALSSGVTKGWEQPSLQAHSITAAPPPGVWVVGQERDPYRQNERCTPGFCTGHS